MSLHEGDLCYMSISVSLCVILCRIQKTQGRARLALGRLSDKLKCVLFFSFFFLLEETLTNISKLCSAFIFSLLRMHDG